MFKYSDKQQLGGLGTAVSSPSGVWGTAPAVKAVLGFEMPLINFSRSITTESSWEVKQIYHIQFLANIITNTLSRLTQMWLAKTTAITSQTQSYNLRDLYRINVLVSVVSSGTTDRPSLANASNTSKSDWRTVTRLLHEPDWLVVCGWTAIQSQT